MPKQPSLIYFVPELQKIINDLRSSQVEICIFIFFDKYFKKVSLIEITSQSTTEVNISLRSLVRSLTPQVETIVLLHNHPSKKSHPSYSDYEATNKLIYLGELLSFKMIDHIIITENDYFSFAEEGVLNDIKNQFA